MLTITVHMSYIRTFGDNVQTVLISFPVSCLSFRDTAPYCTVYYILFTSVFRIREILVCIRIRTSDQRIRIRILLFSSMTFKMKTKKYFFFSTHIFCGKIWRKKLRFPTVKGKRCLSIFLTVHTENISIPAIEFPTIFVPFLYSGVQIKKYAVVNSSLRWGDFFTLFAIDCACEHLA